MCAQNVQEQFRGRGGAHAYNTIMLHSAPTIPAKLKYKWAAPELVEGALVDEAPGTVSPSFVAAMICAQASTQLPHMQRDCRVSDVCAQLITPFAAAMICAQSLHSSCRCNVTAASRNMCSTTYTAPAYAM